MKRIISLLLACLFSCGIAFNVLAEEKTQLIEQCLFKFGNDTCDTALLLTNDNVAVTSDNWYFEYDMSNGLKETVDLTHPELKNASIDCVKIVEGTQCVIALCFDYRSEQSYCVYISQRRSKVFSDLIHGRVDSGCIVSNKLFIAGSAAKVISDTHGQVTSWFRVMSMDGDVECETVLTSMQRENLGIDTSVVQCIEKDNYAILIEQIRCNNDVTLKLIKVESNGSIITTSDIELSALQINITGLEINGVLLENDSIILYGMVTNDEQKSPFMLHSDSLGTVHDVKLFDSSKYFRIEDVINTQNGLIALMTCSDREFNCVLSGSKLDKEFLITPSATERRVPQLLLYNNRDLLVAGSILNMPESPNNIYIALLQ